MKFGTTIKPLDMIEADSDYANRHTHSSGIRIVAERLEAGKQQRKA